MSDNACCSNIPPVIIEGYTSKGSYSIVGDTKVYVTGPQNATRGLLTVYDIFGYGTQTIQGADIIASQLEILVIIPDLFDGKPLDGSVYPPDTEEKKKALGAFFQSGPGQFEPALEKVRSLAQAFKTDFKSVERWGIMGLCWGGKITTLSSTAGSPFSASVQVHPAFLNPDDADNIIIPHLCLASQDEAVDAVASFKQKIESHKIDEVKNKSRVVTYNDMFHGWMGARAALADPKYKAGYEKGYGEVITFLSEFAASESTLSLPAAPNPKL